LKTIAARIVLVVLFLVSVAAQAGDKQCWNSTMVKRPFDEMGLPVDAKAARSPATLCIVLYDADDPSRVAKTAKVSVLFPSGSPFVSMTLDYNPADVAKWQRTNPDTKYAIWTATTVGYKVCEHIRSTPELEPRS
jgi:hypothetical protein